MIYVDAELQEETSDKEETIRFTVRFDTVDDARAVIEGREVAVCCNALDPQDQEGAEFISAFIRSAAEHKLASEALH